ncbi:MAG: DUF5131 family protein [Christensenellales bacterium]
MAVWNPWHGCKKLSPGCQHCYVYRIDGRHGRDSSQVLKTGNFDLPLKKMRKGGYRLEPPETVYTCFTSDFFLEEADVWRPQVYEMMRARSDLHFLIITKRINRFFEGLPGDWGSGYENVGICCTVENQDRADYRLPIFKQLPIRHKSIICEPLLEKVDLSPYLGPWVESVVAGGESGTEARVCDFDWVLDLRRQCISAAVGFYFKQTGAKFKKDNRVYHVPRRFQHAQARKADIDYRVRQ